MKMNKFMENERFSVYIFSMKDNDFERCFFETVLGYGMKAHVRQNRFAEAVFTDMTKDSANSTLMQIKNKSSKTGLPRAIRLSEAFRMAEAAGMPFSTLALEVETKLRLGWKEQEGGGQLALLSPADHHLSSKSALKKTQEFCTTETVQSSKLEAGDENCPVV
jgi:hypothetical protein